MLQYEDIRKARYHPSHPMIAHLMITILKARKLAVNADMIRMYPLDEKLATSCCSHPISVFPSLSCSLSLTFFAALSSTISLLFSHRFT